jgi:hypothetical protein
VLLTLDEKLVLKSRIHNLSFERFPGLYGNIANGIDYLPFFLSFSNLFVNFGLIDAIVLNKMWPLFKCVLGTTKGLPKHLQFVIKSQCYHIQPGIGLFLFVCLFVLVFVLILVAQSYKGHWHTEGLTENIVAAGVYYTHISPHLLGGNVKFRVEKIPQHSIFIIIIIIIFFFASIKSLTYYRL